MSIEKMLEWVKSPKTHAAINADMNRVLEFMVADISKSSFEDVVRDYDDAMDVADLVSGDSLAWDAAMLHLTAVKTVHNRYCGRKLNLPVS